MNEKIIKHLEFIQNVITRMNSNSFLIKGWTITLVSALFALASSDTNLNYVLISYIAIPVFWVIDGFFISTERQYRDLYNEVRLKNEDEVDFDMTASKFNTGKNTWVSGIFSKTLIPFYGVTFGATLIVIIVMFIMKGCPNG